jgi:hypothetical protein
VCIAGSGDKKWLSVCGCEIRGSVMPLGTRQLVFRRLPPGSLCRFLARWVVGTETYQSGPNVMITPNSDLPAIPQSPRHTSTASREPFERSRNEALRFPKQAHDKVRGQAGADAGKQDKAVQANRGAKKRRGDWAHENPPPVEENWWQPPIEDSLKALAKAIGEAEPTIKERNERGGLWIMRIHCKKYCVWFKSKREYENAKARYDKIKIEAEAKKTRANREVPPGDNIT